jgi:regulator of sigma E protease
VITLLAFVGVLVVLILFHELGHFLTAKAHRVKVLEFGFGFPPRLVAFPRRSSVYSLDGRVAAFHQDETVYSLNALPLGGFVKLTGEDSLELRVLVKCASEAERGLVERAVQVGRAAFSQSRFPGRLTLLGVEVGPITRNDVQRARKERAEVLGLGVSIEPQARALAQRSRTKVTLVEAPLAPEPALQRFLDGFAAEVHRGLASKGIGTRAIILGAGSFMNFLLPLLVFTALFMVPQKALEGRVLIQGVAPDSPAAQAGIQPGDIVLQVDGHRVANTGDLAYRIRLNLGDSTTWELVREKQRVTGFLGAGGDPGLTPALPPAEAQRLTVTVVPRWKPPKGQGNAGVMIATVDARTASRSYPVWEAVPKGFVRMGETLLMFRNEIIAMVIGAQEAQVAGIVGIAQLTGEVAQAGWMPTLELMALLSLNLAILNLLPIPALDGGRLLFVALEWVRRGKRISPEREGLVHVVGFVVLIMLMVVISYFDVLRVIRGESLLR